MDIEKAKIKLLVIGGECRVNQLLYPEIKDKFQVIENLLGEIYKLLEN
jgi:hypothetical protein